LIESIIQESEDEDPDDRYLSGEKDTDQADPARTFTGPPKVGLDHLAGEQGAAGSGA